MSQQFPELPQAYSIRVCTNRQTFQDKAKQLQVNFTAHVSLSLPGKRWAAADPKYFWQLLAFRGSQNVQLSMQLLWLHERLSEEWLSLSESLGQAISKAIVWEQLGIVTSLKIPSYDEICIGLTSTCYTSLPPDLILPTAIVEKIQLQFNFVPISPDIALQQSRTVDIQLLVNKCLHSFINSKLGALSITGGLLIPGSYEKVRKSLPSMHSITSTLERYLSRHGRLSKIGVRMGKLHKKLSNIVSISATGLGLPAVIESQIYHQMLRKLQSSSQKKRNLNFDGISEDEIICQSLEKFQDLIDGNRATITPQSQKISDGGNDSEFEDLSQSFEETEDNYSDFEDIDDGANTMGLVDSIEEMTPDSQGSTPCPSAPQTPLHEAVDFDMVSVHSSEYAILDDAFPESLTPVDTNEEPLDKNAYGRIITISSSQPVNALQIDFKHVLSRAFVTAGSGNGFEADNDEDSRTMML